MLLLRTFIQEKWPSCVQVNLALLVLLLSFFSLFPPLASAQSQWEFRQFSVNDGLTQNSVFAIAQDSSGFLWLGTRYGLNRFDAYQFTTFQQQENDSTSLTDNDIRALCYDHPAGLLWVGTMHGLNAYDPDNNRFHRYPNLNPKADSLASTRINRLLLDQKNRLWVGSEEGLFLLDRKTLSFEPISLTDGSTSEPIKCLYQDQQNRLWVGTSHGLYQLIESGDKLELAQSPALAGVRPGSGSMDIRSLAEDEMGQIWIGTRQGLHRLNSNLSLAGSYYHETDNESSLSNHMIQELILDEKGRLWVGTMRGLNIYEPQKDGFFRMLSYGKDARGLSNNSIQSLFKDRKGSIWIGTYLGGVNVWDQLHNRFTNYVYHPLLNSISGNVIGSLLEDQKGNLWIGTNGDGLNYFDRKRNHFEVFRHDPKQPNSIPGNHVKVLLSTKEDKFWLGTYQQGLARFDPTNGQIDTLIQAGQNGLSNNNVYALEEQGTQLWIGTYGGGLNRLHQTTGRMEHFPSQSQDSSGLSSPLVRTLLRDSQQNLWVGTENGLNLVVERPGEAPIFRHFLPNTNIYCIQAGPDGSLWIGTYGNGLIQWHPKSGQMNRYRSTNGLAGDIVFGILPDAEGRLWISTNAGISRLNPPTGHLTSYSLADGLPNLEFSFNAFYRTRAGELIFGGANGMSLLRPEQVCPNDYIPPIVFTDLKVFNKVVSIHDKDGLLSHPLDQTKRLVFRHDQAIFTLGFSALNYISPQKNQYQFQLKGLENHWNHRLGETSATYTIQRPGTYTFRVRAANNDGVWNPVERKLEIVVLPPPWKTWWAFLIYGLLVAAALLLLIRFNNIRHELNLEQLEKTKQGELHQTKMEFFTNITHEFRTPLTLILSPMEELLQGLSSSDWRFSRLSAIKRNTQRLYNLVNQLLTFRQMETDHLHLAARMGDWVAFSQEIYLSFEAYAHHRQVDFQFIAPEHPVEGWFDPDKIEKVLINLLSNAFKFTPEGGRIRLIIRKESQQVHIQVEDNGQGIEEKHLSHIFRRFYEGSSPDQARQFKSSGIGLAISRELIELHRGSISVNSQIGQGACFTLSLPLGNAHLKPEQLLNSQPDWLATYELPSQLVENTQPAPVFSYPQVANLPEQAPETSSKLLLVEDHDELRSYLRGVFSPYYQVQEATNGVEGLQKARTWLPDLVLSDVLMAEMDGFELCQQLKKDLHTSHIPVILLTAQAGTAHTTKGLQLGADDYLNKPFHLEELKLRVQNLILSRQQLRQRFVRVLSLEPREITVTPADEDFLSRSLALVEKEISNPDFLVEDFASQLGVSRSLLFTKIQALTEQTPNKFIQSIRLKRAAQLLSSGQFNVSEVAYQVGFRDPKYFSKSFQKMFGGTPSARLKKGTKPS